MCLTMACQGIQQLEMTLLLLLLWIHNTCSQVYSSYEYNDKNKEPHQPGHPGQDNYQYPGQGHEKPGNAYDGYDYGGYGGGSDYYGAGGFYDYTLEEYNAKPKIMECYTCHYSKHKYHEQGMPNCDEPFHNEGIPTIHCEGLCATTRTIIGDEEYMLIRSCLPNCKDIVDPVSSVQCCFGERCNGAVAGVAGLMANITVCVIGVMVTVLLQDGL